MPELPEVETIARGLANAVVGKTISDAAVSMAKIAVAPPGVSFVETLRGERIEAVGRRGKFIVVQLGSGRRLTVHLRMTGRLIVQAPEVSEPHPYTHIRLTFGDGWRLCFADVRQFGRMRLLAADEVWDADGGVEPLTEAFTSEAFVSMLDGRRTPIDDASARPKAYFGRRKHLCVRGSVGGRDSSPSPRAEGHEAGPPPASRRDPRRTATLHRGAGHLRR